MNTVLAARGLSYIFAQKFAGNNHYQIKRTKNQIVTKKEKPAAELK
jgi:hypothetical protein